MARAHPPEHSDRAWYRVELYQREDCSQKPIVVYARAFSDTHSECRVAGAPVMLPRWLLMRLARRWEMENDPAVIDTLNKS